MSREVRQPFIQQNIYHRINYTTNYNLHQTKVFLSTSMQKFQIHMSFLTNTRAVARVFDARGKVSIFAPYSLKTHDLFCLSHFS